MKKVEDREDKNLVQSKQENLVTNVKQNENQNKEPEEAKTEEDNMVKKDVKNLVNDVKKNEYQKGEDKTEENLVKMEEENLVSNLKKIRDETEEKHDSHVKATFLKNNQETGDGGREAKQNETDPRNNDNKKEKIKTSKKVKKQKQIKQIKGQLTLKQLLLRTNNVGKQKNENEQ